MRISKVYTRTGDSGETSLVGGARVSKSDARVEAYGEVDELNSLIGVVRSKLNDTEIDEVLAQLQNQLFTVGADLASPLEIQVPRMDQSSVDALEEISERYLEQLEPLKEFVLPGGSEAGAALHLARTVARRAERRVVALSASDSINAIVIAYLNRLSDLLFILARVMNHRSGVAEEMADFSERTRR